MMKKLHLFQFIGLGNAIIGELIKNHEQPGIKTPCVMQIVPGPGGTAKIMLMPPVGTPEILYFQWDKVSLWYEVKAKEITNLYIQATSGIALATSMPVGGRG